MNVLKVIKNILWVLLGGLWLAILWSIVGVLFCITIFGVPFDVQCFKLKNYPFFPSRRRSQCILRNILLQISFRFPWRPENGAYVIIYRSEFQLHYHYRYIERNTMLQNYEIGIRSVRCKNKTRICTS